MVVETESGKLIVSDLLIADSFFKRLKGWMFKKNAEEEEGILISPCNSIHTCFMKFEMDAVFLDKEDNILEIINSMKPFKMVMPVKESVKVLELAGGRLKQFSEEIKKGNKLIFK